MNEGVAERAGRFIDLAEEVLADARAAHERDSRRTSLNRSYYAAFYAVSALLTARGLHSSKHRGVLSLFDREFVLTGEMSREHGRALHRLFEKRSEADYDIYGSFDSNEVSDALNSASALIADARDVLERLLNG